MYEESLLYTAEIKGEKKAKIGIARNLLKQNIDIEIIVISTGLSKEEIEVIKNEN